MLLDDKRVKLIITLSLAIIFVVGSTIIFTQEIANIENSVSTKAAERANKIKEKMVLIRSFINTMRQNMQDYISLQENNNTFHPAIDLIKDYPEYNISAIDEKPSKEKFNIDGVFTALGKRADMDIKKVQEISAAFYLKTTYLSAFESIPDLKWVYYLSKDHFMYAAPHLLISLYYLNKEVYKRDYWVNAIPENNPERRLVMTPVYKDVAGKGYLATFSEPVYVDDEFRGTICIDVSLDAFNTIMAMNTMNGDSFLLDENNIIVASNSEGEQGKILKTPSKNLANNIIINNKDGYDYVRYEVISDEVFFLHRLNRELKYKAAFFNSIRELFLLLSSVVMAYMIYYSRILIFRVEQLANTDPLTSLLNRRAMENTVLPLLSINERYDQKMCFLLADIDHFKRVNDTYGHVIGDEVLVSVTDIFTSCLRSSDLLSRHGGEEFLIVLPQTDLESGSLLAERIRTSIENTRSGENRVAVTISIGCVEVRKEEGFDSAITRADNMLYQAKSNGRNQTATDI